MNAPARKWDPSQPLEPLGGGSGDDESGTPWAMIESLRRSGALLVLDEVSEQSVLVEFPFGESWQVRTGCIRFVRLRETVDGATHALVRGLAGPAGARPDGSNRRT